MKVETKPADVFKILNMANVQHFYFVPNSQINIIGDTTIIMGNKMILMKKRVKT